MNTKNKGGEEKPIQYLTEGGKLAVNSYQRGVGSHRTRPLDFIRGWVLNKIPLLYITATNIFYPFPPVSVVLYIIYGSYKCSVAFAKAKKFGRIHDNG